MQKVTKELLTAYETKKVSYAPIDASGAQGWSVTLPSTLLSLVKLREIRLLDELSANMKSKLGPGKKSLFDVWMKEESDLIQGTAKAYGERICLESILAATAAEKDEGVKAALGKVTHLFAHTLVTENLAWFMSQGLVSVASGHVMPELQRALVKDLLPYAMDLVQALGVKPWMVYAPIAKDWAKYNEADNRGELVQARL